MEEGEEKREMMGKWGGQLEQVGWRQGKERKRKGHYLGPWFGPANGGGKWAKLGWNWA